MRFVLWDLCYTGKRRMTTLGLKLKMRYALWCSKVEVTIRLLILCSLVITTYEDEQMLLILNQCVIWTSWRKSRSALTYTSSGTLQVWTSWIILVLVIRIEHLRCCCCNNFKFKTSTQLFIACFIQLCLDGTSNFSKIASLNSQNRG